MREVLLVHGPGAGAADVLGAEHADASVVVPQRHVEHGADAVRDQVAVEELARARIGLRVVRRDHALALDGVEIGGRIAARCSTAPDS